MCGAALALPDNSMEVRTSRLEVSSQLLRGAIEHRYFLPVCVVAGVVLRVLWICFVNAPQVSDFKWYYERAISISTGQGYAVDGIPTAYWPVGYPGFLGVVFTLFGPSIFLAKAINILLYTGITLLTYALSRMLFNSELAARLAFLL